jgi:hypothetical protein
MMPEQLLIVFMIVLLGVVLVHVLSNILTAAKDLETPHSGPCKIHNWYEMIGPDNETVVSLYCIDCKKTPKMIQEEFEE